MQTYIDVRSQDFDLAAEYQALGGDPECGAIVTFTGLVRELHGSKLRRMTLEHYPGMTEKALAQIVAEARQRWRLGGVRMIHRVGELAVNEQIVFVGVAAAHRKDAFAAAQFLMDFLKTKAPFWKKEHAMHGAYWVDAKASDQTAAQRWVGDEIDTQD